MLCEYRSDDRECLAIMQTHFEEIFEAARQRGVELSVTRIGERPCMGEVDLSVINRMTDLYRTLVGQVLGEEIKTGSSSTDCNIPLSLGIPALCIGLSKYSGMHTREEALEKKSFPAGAEVGLRFLLELTQQ